MKIMRNYCVKGFLLLLLFIVTIVYLNTIIVASPGQYIEDVVDYDSLCEGWIAT